MYELDVKEWKERFVDEVEPSSNTADEDHVFLMPNDQFLMGDLKNVEYGGAIGGALYGLVEKSSPMPVYSIINLTSPGTATMTIENCEATDKAMKGGWFHTGDLAVMHPDGYVKIQDRSKDIIISGGENISSIEIENTLAKHPSVSIAAVVAKPDEKWGEVPCAFIESVKDKTVTEKELIDFCKETLAKFKVPKKIEFCELPKTSTGKIQKFELRKKAKELS